MQECSRRCRRTRSQALTGVASKVLRDIGMTSSAVSEMLERRAELLRFVRGRVESDAVAEEILQSALLRGVEHAAELRADESAVAWMYRTLRNAVVDHYRRRDAAGRALEEVAAGATEASDDVPPDEKPRACACVRRLAKGLKPEYARMLEQVDLEERSLGEVAAEAGITTNNAAVRLHRARAALREAVVATCKSCATHGCVDCTCKHGV
ncbi:MAG: sigma-70 family RNA polymerase sigma factor [Labilithrix sp.]|nr:sigma-70 family RNA polymerase sigma factor [Labilithrix sp.]MCW5815019.1 sigma-70 family RNA polymerase sigma factor [Labilithrix sp.]